MPFPKKFLFGSATSAHQTEGGNIHSDWFAWEQTPGNIRDGSSSILAADSWNKFEQDIQLLKDSNQNAYRFSIEWARIEPKKGKFDPEALEHYRKELQLLKKNNIMTMVTLFHFTLPQWVAEEGGFTNKKTTEYFCNFVQKVTQEYHQYVDFWVTLNEPTVYSLKSYLQGEWPPCQKSKIQFLKSWIILANTHNKAYDLIKKIYPTTKVGIVLNMANYLPTENSYLNKILCYIIKFASNEIFTRQIIKRTDFLGINYYMQFIIKPTKPMVQSDPTKKSDFGWALHPEGIYQVIKDNVKWGKPIYITENGLADEKDENRPKFIEQTLEWIKKTIEEGAPVKGYFHWSLLDNFEWAEGYKMKFGLHTIDRKPRSSVKHYANLIKKYQS